MGAPLALVAALGCAEPWFVPTERTGETGVTESASDSASAEDCSITDATADVVDGTDWNNTTDNTLAVCSGGDLTNNAYGGTFYVHSGGILRNQGGAATIYAELGATVLNYTADATLVYGMGADIGNAEQYADVTECLSLELSTGC